MDAVITYVDCNKDFEELYKKQVNKDFSLSRFRSYHVLDLQIKLIRKYMPYIKNIFVVVYDKSQVEEYSDLSSAIIIEHSQIIPSQYLPCFNSCTIEMFLHNIPRLSEQFIYFNDDMFVINKISQLEFFKGAQPVLSPKIKDIPENPNVYEQQCINSTNEILKKLKKENSYKGKYFVQEHICKPYLKRTFSILWSRCKDDINYSLTRTRHKKNYNCYLFNNYDIVSDNYVNKKHEYLYIDLLDSPIKLKNKICLYDKSLICINDNGEYYDFNELKTKIKEALLWHLNKDKESKYIEEKEVEKSKIFFNNTPLKVALCAIAKNENFYIREWVEYYKKLGISKIFLYDNNDINGERFEEVINDYIKSKFVEIINVRGIEKGCVYDEEGINLQPKCYIDCYENRTKNFDWICFFDIDEFLVFKNGYSLYSFLNDNRFNNFETILIPWEFYDDNNIIERNEYNVFNTFNHISKNKKYHAPKSIVRTNQKVLDKCQRNLIHIFTLSNKKIINANFTIPQLNKKGDWYLMDNEAIQYCGCILNHYKTKTLKEFIGRQYGRHWGTAEDVTIKARNIYDCLVDFYKYNYWNNDKAYFLHKNLNYNAIISLTSWKKRINNCIITLENLFNICGNKYKYVLTLSLEEFPLKENELPDKLLNIIREGKLEIIWVEKNYYCYKKVVFTMNRYPNIPIISADDDCIYKYDYATELYEKWLKNPLDIITSLKENKWEIDKKTYLFSHGCATLYPPSSLLRLIPYLEDNEIINRKNDDSLYGIYAKKEKINILYLNHKIDEILEFHTNNDAITWKITNSKEKFLEDKKIFIKKLS